MFSLPKTKTPTLSSIHIYIYIYISSKIGKKRDVSAQARRSSSRQRVICLSEGQVSSTQILFLGLGEGLHLCEGPLRLSEPEAHLLINASFTSAKGCFALANPRPLEFFVFSFTSSKLSLRLGEPLHLGKPLHLGEAVLLSNFCFLALFALFFAFFTFYSCKT